MFRIFDRQEWLRANRARARIKVFVDKYGIDELRSQVEEELQGDWVAERDFSIEHRLFDRRRARERARAAAELRQPQRRPLRVRALPRRQRARAEAGGLRDGRGQGHPRRPHARAVPRPGGDHARLRRRLRAHDRAAEPACCAGCARSASTTSGGRCRSSASATRARARSTTSSPAPARTPASSGSRARWASTRPSRSGSRRWTSPTR